MKKRAEFMGEDPEFNKFVEILWDNREKVEDENVIPDNETYPLFAPFLRVRSQA